MVVISSLLVKKNLIPTETEYGRWLAGYTAGNKLPHLPLVTFRVAIDWRRKGIDRQSEAKKKNTHPGSVAPDLLRRRQTEKKNLINDKCV